MPVVPFHKLEGLGNDFIVIEGPDAWITPEAARRLCDRKRGIGGDGVLTLLSPRGADAGRRMHVTNADGSIPEMCGNGLRCVVRFILERSGESHITIDTDAGTRRGWLLPDGRVRVTMGDAVLIDPELDARASTHHFSGTAISMGNPHLVLRALPAGTDLMALARALGPGFERHPRFPDRVNVGFVAVRDPQSIDLVVFERGSGITEACGTGAAAAAVAARREGVVRSSGAVRVFLPGGPLDVELEGDPAEAVAPGDTMATVLMTGEARFVFSGQVEVADSELRGAHEERSA